MSTPETDAEIVATCEAAATYLSEHGLARGSYLNAAQQACTTGALIISHSGKGIFHSSVALERALGACPAVPAVAQVVRERHPSRLAAAGAWGRPVSSDAGAIYAFNDHRDTTWDDVIEVLRETIKRHTPDEYRSTPGEGP